jgi:hypothetical protein
MNYVILQKSSVRWLLITGVLDALFFSLTDPARVAPLWLIVGFILAVATMYWFFRAAMLLLGVYSKAVRKQARQLARVLTLAAALLIALQSMGQLSLRDVLVLAPLLIIAYTYIRYNRGRPTA